MALRQLISRFGSNIGVSDRTYLLAKLNEAAREVYESTDIPGCLRECVVTVGADGQSSLPPFIGDLRAMREYSYMNRINLRDMSPRYSNAPWSQLWRNWRLKGRIALQHDILNASPMTLTIGVADDTVVTIIGATGDSARIKEEVTLSSQSVTLTNSFTSVESITKNEENDYDITLTDADGRTMAVIPNNEIECFYTLVDVSQYPFSTTGNVNYIETLYKWKLPRYRNDGDNFPLAGFEDCVFYKAMSIWAGTQEGKTDQALVYEQKCIQRLQQAVESAEGTVEKQIDFGHNPFLDPVPRGLDSFYKWVR